MTKTEIQKRQAAIWNEMDEIEVRSRKEDGSIQMTDADAAKYDALVRESAGLSSKAKALASDAELANMRSNEEKGAKLREMLKNCVQKRENATTVLANAVTEGTDKNEYGNLEAGGLIPVTIREIIDTKVAGIELPDSLTLVTGVTGTEIIPYSTNDVKFSVNGEVQKVGEQGLDFAKIQAAPQRVAASVAVSHRAIDNAAFDLLGYVQQKFALAQKKYLAKKLYSQANWSGNKGPFSNLTPAGTITLGSGNDYKAILQAVAAFTNKGFDADKVCLVIDATTEADLKATPKAVGQGGFIIENGKLAGYDYVVTHFINTELSGSQLVETTDKYIGIGYFEWMAIQQHGDVRFVVDPVTLADRNITRLILNTAWSMTDLSTRINGGNPTDDGHGNTVYPTQAFALYKVEEASEEETTTEA